jgi:hypothetical protein
MYLSWLSTLADDRTKEMKNNFYHIVVIKRNFDSHHFIKNEINQLL